MKNVFIKSRGLLRSLIGKSVLVVTAVFLLADVPGWTAGKAFVQPAPANAPGQKAPEAGKVPAPAAPTAIPVAEVALRATEVSKLLQTIAANLAPTPEIETIRSSLDEITRLLDSQVVGSTIMLQGQPTLATIQAEQQMWQQKQLRTTAWLNVLTDRAKQFDDALRRLADVQKTWTMTLDAARASKALQPVVRQVQITLAAIAAFQSPIQTRLSAILDLQSRVAHIVNICANELTQIARVRQRVVVGTFARDSQPIWSARLWARARDAAPFYFDRIFTAFRNDIEDYVTDPSEWMPAHAALIIVLVLLFCAARRQVRRWREVGEGELHAIMVFEHPYAAALTVSLLFISSPFWQSSATIRVLVQTIALVPMIVLAGSVIDRRLVSGLYLLGVLFVIDAVRQTLAGVPLVGQAALVFESLMGTAVVGWVLTLGALRLSNTRENGLALLSSFRLLAFFILFVFFTGLAAAATGYTNLARLMTPGVLVGGTIALSLYVTVQVACGATAFAFRVWPLRKLLMVQHHREFLEKRIRRLFIWAAVIGWLVRYLDYMGLLSSTLSIGKSFLAIKLERGEVSISLGDIVIFFLTIWVSYLLSSSIRFVLREDLYPRMGVAPGQSYAASSLIHYVIITLGLFAAIGMLGVNLTRVTVMAGALGVGIGFGLQNMVNNFVSGLILLFERPIHVGDTIEVGDLLGQVRRIGMRTSTVHTWGGADIIVPNSQLTGEKVTNWTLSDRLRRIDLPVGVNYGARPREVISILESVSAEHPDVLKHPSPQGLFTGYGDSSINFELRAWTDRFDDWPRIRSELAVAVYDAVYKAGMTFPFPQRDVHLLGDSVPGQDAVPAGEVSG
jgi:potassium efflux system protein